MEQQGHDFNEDVMIHAEFRELDPNIGELDGVPIYIVFADSSHCQPMFYGPASTDKVNLNRLRNFTSKDITIHELELYPHPLG